MKRVIKDVKAKEQKKIKTNDGNRTNHGVTQLPKQCLRQLE